MAGGQLGSLISLTQGLQMQPIQSARDFSIQNQSLQAQIQASLAGQGLEQQRIDISRQQGLANQSFAERQLTARGQEAATSRTFQAEQAGEQRSLDRELAQLQKEGRLDLQDLIGEQEISQINLQNELNLDLQESQQAFQIKQAELLATETGDNLDRTLKQSKDDADRRFKLLQNRGEREKARKVLEDRADNLKIAALERAAKNEPDANEIKAIRALARDEASTRLAIVNLEFLGRLSVKDQREMNDLQLKLARTEVEEKEAGVRVEEAEAEVRERALKKADETAAAAKPGTAEPSEDGPQAQADIDTITNLTRLTDAEGHFDTAAGFVTGNTLALNALNSLEDFAGEEAGVKENRKLLRELATLGRKLGKGQAGGSLTDFEKVMGPQSLANKFSSEESQREASGMTPEEQKRILELIERFKDLIPDLVD